MNSDLFFGKWCSECDEEKTNFNWCSTCNAKRFRQNFENWTSGNDNINKFIRDAQLSADDYFKVLEWIPFDRFYDIEFVARGGFGSVYKARWIDGSIRNWDDKNQVWERLRQNDFVALKSLNDSSNVSLEFIREITCHKNLDISASIIKLYGITQEPETKNYMMVMEYAENGSLRDYLNKNNNLSWKDKIRNMHYIALGLTKIHEKGLIHRDLHSGNIVMHNDQTCITDMGLCRPVSDNTKSIYGIIPYIAPEILQGKSYTKAADIYSFGIIMYEIISGLRPHFDRKHNDFALIQEIWKGLRPKFNIKVPKLILDLINKCLDGNPSNRPTANEIVNILHKWLEEINSNQNNQMNQSKLILQIKEADKFNKINSSTRSKPLNSKLFSDAVYRSSKIICSSVINRTNNSNMNASYQVSQVNFSDLEISNSYGSGSCQVTQVNS